MEERSASKKERRSLRVEECGGAACGGACLQARGKEALAGEGGLRSSPGGEGRENAGAMVERRGERQGKEEGSTQRGAQGHQQSELCGTSRAQAKGTTYC